MQPPNPPTPPGVSTQKEEPVRSSLAPTQFEELFGEGAEGLLEDVLDRPDAFSKDQRDLAMAILGGDKSINSADAEDRTRINEIAHNLAFLNPITPKTPVDDRPVYVRTRAEMEDFGDGVNKNAWPEVL